MPQARGPAAIEALRQRGLDTSLLAAVEAARYAARADAATPGVHHVANAAQGLRARLAPEASTVSTDAAEVRLVLTGLGWLTLTSRLTAPASADGSGVEFLDATGRPTLRYDHLAVNDAAGRALPARMRLGAGVVTLEADDAGAVYPVTIDPPFTQQAYLKASNTRARHNFGYSVAVAGDTVAVGAWQEASGATGVNGDQSDNRAVRAGAAYVFVRSGTTWSQQAYLKGSNAQAGDNFGWSVAVAGDTVVVGAPWEASSATGVNGAQSDDRAAKAGAAYVFARNATTWSQQAYLKASNTDANDELGISVAVAGDTVVVGAMGEDSSATGVNSTQSDNSAQYAGAAYVFVRGETTWSELAFLQASNAEANDRFGSSVAVAGDTVVVGAPYESSGATGVNGTQSNNSADYAGAAYAFGLSTDADHDDLPGDWEMRYGLDPTSPVGDNGASGDPDGDGVTNAGEFIAGSHPRGFVQRFLAEGATSAFLDTRLALLNPGATAAEATLTFTRAGASAVAHAVLLPARTRVTVDPKTIAGMAKAEFSTRVESSEPLIVDRTLSWDVAHGCGAHAEKAVATPALTWYLAEGATHSGFNRFYLLQNPNTVEAQVRVCFLRPSGAPLEKTSTLPPSSRNNIWVNEEAFPGLGKALAATDVSAVFASTNNHPIIVERALYQDLPGQTFGAGHASAGVTAPALEWFLAEGNTGPYFDLFVLIANPGDADAQVEATYLRPDGTRIVKTHTARANSRVNIWVDGEDPRLANTAVSTTIRSTNGVPVIVERALWWPGSYGQWFEAHNSPGATATGTTWALAEGEVGGTRGVETYILVANTSATAGSVMVTLLFEDGTSTGRTFTVTGNSRFNVDVQAEFPSALGKRFGAIVESVGNAPVQIVVERAMYWDALGQHWAAGTDALATKLR